MKLVKHKINGGIVTNNMARIRDQVSIAIHEKVWHIGWRIEQIRFPVLFEIV